MDQAAEFYSASHKFDSCTPCYRRFCVVTVSTITPVLLVTGGVRNGKVWWRWVHNPDRRLVVEQKGWGVKGVSFSHPRSQPSP